VLYIFRFADGSKVMMDDNLAEELDDILDKRDPGMLSSNFSTVLNSTYFNSDAELEPHHFGGALPLGETQCGSNSSVTDTDVYHQREFKTRRKFLNFLNSLHIFNNQ
jgi:hypothetical protein